MKNIQKTLIGGLITLTASLAFVGSVSAWGPDRTTYTMANPAHSATFNSITDNAAVGDERDFVRIVEIGTGGAYSDEIQVEAGKKYEVYIYYHNDASSTFNDAEHDYIGVARETRLMSSFSDTLKAGEKGVVYASISASNTTPEKVWDEAYVVAKDNLTLHYLNGSAKIYNDWGVNGSVLPTSLFSSEGTFLGLNELNGIILGCDEYSGQVVYTLVAVGEDTPVDPDEPVNPGNPDTPGSIPETGPAEIALASVVIVAIIAGVAYWYKTNKAVRKVTRRVTASRKNIKRRK